MFFEISNPFGSNSGGSFESPGSGGGSRRGDSRLDAYSDFVKSLGTGGVELVITYTDWYQNMGPDGAFVKTNTSVKITITNGGGKQQANAGALPFYVAAGATLTELGEAVLIAVGRASMIITLLSIPGDTRIDKATKNPIFPGPHSTGRGEIDNWDVKGFDNTKYGPPEGPPGWFWPWLAGAAAYELYENWPIPNMPQPQPVKKPALSPYR